MAQDQRIQNQRATMLLDKLKSRAITLAECYELRSWVQAAYVATVMSPDIKTAFALFVIAAINSKIIEMENPPC